MKKRFVSIVLTSIMDILIICFNAGAVELPDLVSMDFETLSELKQAVEKEMNSRPDAEPFVLSEGSYIVGEDIKAGTYYAYMGEPIGEKHGVFYLNAECYVYENEDAYKADNYEYLYDVSKRLGEEPESITLAKGNCLVVEHNPMSFSSTEPTEEDYYQYTPPEGTFVPAGIYTVGVDIPAGAYRLYPATIMGGSFGVYQTQEAMNTSDYDNIEFYDLYVKKNGAPENVSLIDGNIVSTDIDCIMAKPAVLDFD